MDSISPLQARLTSVDFSQPAEITALQAEMDGMVSGFFHEASNTNTLASIAAGSLANGFIRVGVIGLGARSSLFAPLVRPAACFLGLGGEVVAFEGTNRTLLTLSPLPWGEGVGRGSPSPLEGEGRGEGNLAYLWSWSGPGGWREGIGTGFITFGTLRSAGHLSRGASPFVQHAFASSAMVFGHQTASVFEFIPPPEGSLTQQFLHASVTDLQLRAGTGLMHATLPGIHSLERGLDLSVRSEIPPTPFGKRGGRGDLEPACATVPSEGPQNSSRTQPSLSHGFSRTVIMTVGKGPQGPRESSSHGASAKGGAEEVFGTLQDLEATQIPLQEHLATVEQEVVRLSERLDSLAGRIEAEALEAYRRELTELERRIEFWLEQQVSLENEAVGSRERFAGDIEIGQSLLLDRTLRLAQPHHPDPRAEPGSSREIRGLFSYRHRSTASGQRV